MYLREQGGRGMDTVDHYRNRGPLRAMHMYSIGHAASRMKAAYGQIREYTGSLRYLRWHKGATSGVCWSPMSDPRPALVHIAGNVDKRPK